MYTLKFKRDNISARINFPALEGDVGYDICSLEEKVVWPLFPKIFKTGVYLELPNGYFADIRTRSGHGVKNNLRTHLGTLDSGYRGEVGIKLYNLGWKPYKVQKGEKIAQIVLHKAIVLPLEEVKELNPSVRNERGFGSTGRK